jgi:hypothetical protein
MKTHQIVLWHIKQVQWAVWLSQASLTGLRPGDWQNLREDFWEFITVPRWWTGMIMLPSGKTQEEYLEKLSNEAIGEIQKWLRSDLLRYSAHDSVVLGTGIKPKQIEFNFTAFGIDSYFQVLMQAGDPITDARLSLGFHLVGGVITPSSIRSCPQCEQLFVRERKLREDISNHYCSTRCARNAAAQAYRTREGAKLKASERDRSHRRYVSQTRRTVGPNVKVKRRPRPSK